jgi:hypothetical protein
MAAEVSNPSASPFLKVGVRGIFGEDHRKSPLPPLCKRGEISTPRRVHSFCHVVLAVGVGLKNDKDAAAAAFDQKQ